MELFEMTAASLSEKLRKKECSAVEITRSVLEQIEKTEDKIGSFVTVCEEQALKRQKKWIGKLRRAKPFRLLQVFRSV